LALHGALRIVQFCILFDGAHFAQESADIAGAVFVRGHDAGEALEQAPSLSRPRRCAKSRRKSAISVGSKSRSIKD
jgi:hypothetical protein